MTKKESKVYFSKYREAHRESLREYHKKWRTSNRDKWLGYEHTEDRKSWKKSYLKDWRKSNPYKTRLHSHKRRAAGKISVEIIQQVYEKNILRFSTLTCELCFKPISFGLDSLEHKLPISRGGTNDFANLAVAHKKCNYSKRQKTMEEWFALSPTSVAIKVPK